MGIVRLEVDGERMRVAKYGEGVSSSKADGGVVWLYLIIYECYVVGLFMLCPS